MKKFLAVQEMSLMLTGTTKWFLIAPGRHLSKKAAAKDVPAKAV
jgi:hypothetical protein